VTSSRPSDPAEATEAPPADRHAASGPDRRGPAIVGVLAAVLLGLVLVVWWSASDEDGPPGAPTEAPSEPAPESTPDSGSASDPEVLWVGDFGGDQPWQESFGVAAASRENAQVVDEGPDGRQDVLEISFGDTDDVRWGIDYRLSFAALGLEEREAVRFSYDVYFAEDFEFIGDGKLGGLAGLTDELDPLETSSGGDYDERSFSVRAMWKEDRGVVMYLYARHANGRDFHDPAHFGYGIPVRFQDADGAESGIFTPGTWHRVEHRVRLNTPGQNDGAYELWIDGHRGVHVDDVQYRTEAHPELRINQVIATWFFGGGQDQFPTRRNVAYTDDWMLTDHPEGS
jgi:hypothetical protein